MKNLIVNLAKNSHANFWVAIFPFLQKWHHTYLLRAYTKVEVSLYIGYYPRFLPHLAQEKMIPHPTQNTMTLSLTFVPSNQNILTWATLHFAMLHHCISSVLCCNQNTHFMQGSKIDYTHAYSHPLLNLLSCQTSFWSLSVFSLLHFLFFSPIQLPLVNWWHTVWTFPWICLFS